MVNLRINKQFLCCCFNLNRSFISQHFAFVSKSLYIFLARYDDASLMGNFGDDTNNTAVDNFFRLFNLKYSINIPTCYYNPDNTCVFLKDDY